jgi:adenine phosphoribosyltransferase
MFCDVISKLNVQAIVGLESRGFILAGAIAYKLGLSIVLIRKKNKLPGAVKSIGYTLHYGTVGFSYKKIKPLLVFCLRIILL